MNLREKILINALIAKKQINIDEISSKFNLSYRTINKDIEDILDFFISNDISNLISREKNIVYFLGNKCEIEQIQSLISKNDYYSYRLNPAERVHLIMLDLLLSNDYKTVSDFEKNLFVSRGTILNDIKCVKKWLAAADILLKSVTNKGYICCCEEVCRRKAIINIINESKVNNEQILNGYYQGESLKKIFRGLDLKILKNIILKAEEKFNIFLTDISYESLIIHISLAIQRIKENMYIDFDKYKPNIMTNNNFRIAVYITEQLEEDLNIKIPYGEICYIALHLSGKNGMDNKVDMNEDWLFTQMLVINLIKNIEKEISVRFENDKQLYEGLFKHLSTAIYRMKNKISQLNPLKSELIKEFPQLYHALVKNINLIEEYAKAEMLDDEIGYLIVHFGAALEKIKPKSCPPKILVICSTGMGTARLVTCKIRKHFYVEIVDIISGHQIIRYEKDNDNVDLIISTIPISSSIYSIQISPLVTEKDIKTVKDYFNKNGFKNFLIETNSLDLLFNDLLDAVDKHCITINKKLFNKEVLSLSKKYNVSRTRRTKKMLSDILKPNHILLDKYASDWQEAIRISGEILEENGIVSREYIKEMINNVKDMGPYVVITKGVAIPHGRPEKGAKKVGISLVRLEKGVNFGSKSNDPVKYIFGISAIDSKSHLNAISELVELLDKENFYQVIGKTKDPNEIYRFIKEYEFLKQS